MTAGTAVVTGGAGFIGSNLVDRLIAEGWLVTVLDDLSTGRRANLDGAASSGGDRLHIEVLDVRRPEATDLVADLAPDVVHHLAAQADVRHSVADPVHDAEVNVLGTLRVLEGVRRAGVGKVVLAGSGGTLYGDPDPARLPLDETAAVAPGSPYGASKAAAGMYLATYARLHGVDSTVLALANVYGPRQDPHGEAGVVAIFSGLLLSGRPCTVYGTGEQTRDYVFVDDVVDAVMRAGASNGCPLANVGTGVETSVNDLHAAMAERVDPGAEVVRAPARPGELDRSALDPSLAGTALGWRPAIPLAEGVGRTIAWFRANQRED